MSLSTAELERYVKGSASTPERWAHLIRHSDEGRVYAQIADEPEVNAWVICWSEDQDTGFHDHDDSAAAIAVISGQVREERMRVGRPPASRRLAAGSVFTVPPVAIHRVIHAGHAPAVTIHAYSPPLVRAGAYRVSEEGELQREALPFEAELRGEPATVTM